MNKLSISINILALQGAHRVTSAKGKDCLVIDLDSSRLKAHQNGKIYLNLEAIENRDGEDKFGNSHFVCEPVTKEERQEGVKLPIIGNGKTYSSQPKGQQRPAPRQLAKKELTTDEVFNNTPLAEEDFPF